MSTARPLVSIIIPSYNQGSYIRETIDSVLAQEYRPIEILVIDGGSSDETVEVLRSYGAIEEMKWWSEPDRGVVDAVNKGMARVKGEIVAIQSSDDGYLPGAFATVAEYFLGHPDAALVYGDVEYIDSQSRVTGRTVLGPFELAAYVGKMSYIPQPAAFFRASAMREAGFWREDISYAADAEFFLRIAARTGAVKLDFLLARYRYHEAQRDKESNRVPTDWERAIEPWTRHPDRRLRRRARAGIWLVRHHYARDSNWALRNWASWRALIADPSVWLSIDRRDLLPGRGAIWPFLSKVKRALGLRPRGETFRR